MGGLVGKETYLSHLGDLADGGANEVADELHPSSSSSSSLSSSSSSSSFSIRKGQDLPSSSSSSSSLRRLDEGSD